MRASANTWPGAAHPRARTDLLVLAVQAYSGAVAGDGARVTGLLDNLAREKRMG